MDCCSVKHCTSHTKHCMIAVGIIGELTPRFRSLIGHDDDQLCNIHRFAPTNPTQLEGGVIGENVKSADHVGRFHFQF